MLYVSKELLCYEHIEQEYSDQFPEARWTATCPS